MNHAFPLKLSSLCLAFNLLCKLFPSWSLFKLAAFHKLAAFQTCLVLSNLPSFTHRARYAAAPERCFLGDRLRREDFKPGQSVIRQGDVADTLVGRGAS